MKRFIILLALMGAMFAMSPSTAMAGQHADTVAATVTARFISLSLAVTNVDYGVLEVGDTDEEPNDQVCGSTLNPAFTVTNNGNADEEFLIKGANTSGGWSLVNTGPSTDQYRHSFATDPTACTWAFLTTSDTSLVDPITPASSIDTYLRLDMPADTTVTSEQTLQVIITATTPTP